MLKLHHDKKNGRGALAVIWVMIGLVFFFSLPAEARTKKRRSYSGVSCRAAIFSDATRLKRLYGKNADLKIFPASTVKVMTALLVLERLPLDQTITASQNSTYPQPSKIYLKEGEVFTVRDLLYAVLLSSANDASVALAEAVAGSESNFVNLMNQRARELGAKNTHFVNPHGLPSPERQYTTPYDMYLIFRQALNHPFFRQTIKIQYATISSQDGRSISLKNHNKVLFNGGIYKAYGKTGYTRSAGPCFVGMVERNNRTMIMALFNCPNRWADIKYLIAKYAGI